MLASNRSGNYYNRNDNTVGREAAQERPFAWLWSGLAMAAHLTRHVQLEGRNVKIFGVSDYFKQENIFTYSIFLDGWEISFQVDYKHVGGHTIKTKWGWVQNPNFSGTPDGMYIDWVPLTVIVE